MSKIFVNVIAFILIAAMAIGVSAIFSFNDTEYLVTITDKERVYSDDESKYLVFAEDENGNSLVFENTDNLLRGKWNSSTIQGALKVGEKYTVTVVGYRFEFLSWYQNIIKVKEGT